MECHHDNLTRFVGASIDKHIALLIEYCPKGSLQVRDFRIIRKVHSIIGIKHGCEFV